MIKFVYFFVFKISKLFVGRFSLAKVGIISEFAKFDGKNFGVVR